jgi:phosphoribosylamine-glycine ligase
MKASKEDEEPSTSVFKVRTDVTSEDVLVNASEILASASIMANEQAFSSTGSRRLQIFGLAQLIENAQLLVDDALDKLSATAADH